MIQTHGHGILKSTFLPLQSDIPIPISRFCVGSTSEKR